MLENYFYATLITPVQEKLEQLYYEASIEKNYYLSPANVLRCDVSKEIREYLSKLFIIELADCGFLKSPPNYRYPVHTDRFRITALNMPMFAHNESFESYIIDDKNPKVKEPITYKKDHFTILNVAKLHGVNNNSLDLTRIILSIGIKNTSYDKVLNLYKENKLIHVV